MQEIKIPDGCKASIDFGKRVVVIEDDSFALNKGDICVKRNKWIFIFSHTIQMFSPDAICYYVLTSKMDRDLIRFNKYGIGSLSDKEEIRLATHSEAQLLFDALAKKGKKWNPETMQIEDIENTILVPENISVYKRKIGDSGNYGDGLFIGFNSGQRLGVKRSKYNVDVDGFGLYEKVQCKLTPCKREDLNVGDTVVIVDKHIKIEDALDDIDSYNKVVGYRAYANVEYGCDIQVYDEKILPELSEHTFYKVEPLNR